MKSISSEIERISAVFTLFVLSFGCVAVLSTPAASQQFISGKDISELISQHLSDQGIASHPAISEARQFRACATPLQITPLFGSYKTVSVICDDDEGWKLAVRTQISTASSAQAARNIDSDLATGSDANDLRVVLVTSIKKGEVITASDIAVKNVTRALPKDTFTRVQDVIGRIAKKNITVDQPVRAAHLEMNWTIKKGQKVILISQIGPVHVAGEGVALENAQWGQMARFLNVKSNREVEGFVDSEKKIIIGPKTFRN